MATNDIIKMITQPIKSITHVFKNISLWGKVLIFIILVLMIHFTFFKTKQLRREGFQNTEKFLLHEGPQVYDDFYSNVYDHLVYNTMLDEYEVGYILNKSTPTSESIILDIGSGTGHIVSKLAHDNKLNVTGLDNSPSMIAKAKENYPDLNFVQGDALKATTFGSGSFTHILCLYFTIYYMEDKAKFFKNCMNWLMPGGYLVIHLVDRDMFDPIIPPANPLVLLTPQRYAKERITKSRVTFDDFKYSADFQLDNNTDNAKFVEKFHFNDGAIRKNEHQMHMPSETAILQMAQEVGFIIHAEADLIKVGYEYNKLYILTKPN